MKIYKLNTLVILSLPRKRAVGTPNNFLSICGSYQVTKFNQSNTYGVSNMKLNQAGLVSL